MSKYTIRIEGGDIMEHMRTVECDGFAILAMNDPDVGDVTLHEINLLELAALIASSKDMRDAAKLAAALEQIHPGKQLSTVIEEICEGE